MTNSEVLTFKKERKVFTYSKWDENCILDLIISQSITVFPNNINYYYSEFLIAFVFVVKKKIPSALGFIIDTETKLWY